MTHPTREDEMNTKWNRTRTLGFISLGCLAVVALTTTLTAAPKGSNIKVSAPVESPDIIAVRIRHDMCPFCKKFDPAYPMLIRQTKSESVLFVTLDLTNEATQKQAALMVGALGLQNVWTGDMSKMGTITFVDGKSKRLLSSVHQIDMKTVQDALHEAVIASLDKP